MNTDVMIDLETLDVLPSATILTIGAVKFDPFGDDMREKNCEKFYVKVDIDSCDRLGLTTSAIQLIGGHNKLKQHKMKHLVQKIEFLYTKQLINYTNSVGEQNVYGPTEQDLILLF